MDAQAVITFIKEVGFPIAVCCAFGWYIYKQNVSHQKQLDTMAERHQHEMDKVVGAVENNTKAINDNALVLKTLCERIGN